MQAPNSLIIKGIPSFSAS